MVDVLLGLQWGDEGKGKIVDYLAPRYDMVARFQGGPNAGHTLNIEGKKFVLHTIPSGVFNEKCVNLIGNGVVIDPVIFKKEVTGLEQIGISLVKKLFISKKAHLILPSHRVLDAASEAQKGDAKIGSTLKGIGPAYMDKTGRNGLRVGDIVAKDFQQRYNHLKEKHLSLLKLYDFKFDLASMEEEWFAGIESIRQFTLTDGEYFVNDFLQNGKKVLAEGAQGSMLDIDFGTYPFVTSSNTITAGACTGLGISPQSINKVMGITKAYCTRVGGGPFPTELLDETGEALRKEGQEFGATTGRPRRCGWLDLVALKYTIMLSGVTDLIVTKADVLSIFDEIKVCTKYKVNGELSSHIPFDICNDRIEPQYEVLKGWSKAINTINKKEHLPGAITDYISYLQKQTGIKVLMLSVGPGREQLIEF